MIIWINGPFGSGKSTLAAALKAIVADSLVVDLEELGAFARQTVPPAASGDFQRPGTKMFGNGDRRRWIDAWMLKVRCPLERTS